MNYLLAISIGPVQDFIAAARRTSDLQAGSALLVEIARRVAQVLDEHGPLIFPASATGDGPNKLLAETTHSDPAALALQAREAAENYLQDVWNQALEKLPASMRAKIDTRLAESQIRGFLEFYAAWVPFEPQDYAEARKTADRLLAGRKALRDFEVLDENTDMTRTGRPKSPLDPSRDCALHVEAGYTVPKACQQYPLWLKERESLDAVSLLKRVCGQPPLEIESPAEQDSDVRIPSTSLLAARAILPELEQKADAAIRRLHELVRKAGSGSDIADFLFPGRLDELEEELGADQRTVNRLTKADWKEAERLGKEALKAIGRSECPPYYAILVADGDRMGELLNTYQSPEEHRTFSATLARFAAQAKTCVRQHQGHLVYSGGDDVLALLPVPRSLACAAELACLFRETLGSPQGVGTLSVGVAIVHHMEPLLVSLDRARAAEKEAKRERNSLAVVLHTRGGEPMKSTRQWNEPPDMDDWNNLIVALRGDTLSRGVPYELRILAREWPPPEQWKEAAARSASRLQEEARRILRRKRGGEEGKETPQVEKLRVQLEQQDTPEKLEAFAQKLVIARFLAELEPRGKEGERGR